MTIRYRSLLSSAMLVLALGAMLGACRSYPECKKDDHCVSYERGTPYCVNNICRECMDDSGCERGERCSDYTCTPIPGWCEDDNDCSHPMVCRDNRCEPECRSDAECGDRERCNAGECVEAECRSDEMCEEGFRCENYTCQPIPVVVPCPNRAFSTVYFDFDESVLNTSARGAMDDNLECYAEYSEDTLLAGHADERGTTEYNIALGERRARAVRNWLQDNGIERSRMRTISYGESRPASRGSNESAWRQNRRVELSWE